MGLIPEEIIAQVVDRCDIVETIAGYIPLKRAGRSFKANCPFHNEKTPSFVVNPDKQIFHCFGCGAGGNVVGFIMRQERMEFPEAIRFLAQKVNVPIPSDEVPVSHTANVRQAIGRVNALAVNFFHKTLLSGKSADAQKAREYLQKRKVSLEMVRTFQLGFAPESWDALLSYLSGERISLGLMEKAGLIVPREKGQGYYDRFRNRIIFPIFDTRAHCRAFGARALEKGALAKYINSPETILYTKGHHVYGFHLAKQAIGEKDEVIIVEGYMDCLVPYQAGINNIVASLGTALTVEQIRLLRRYTHRVVMLFDMDAAGESAIMRSLDTLIEEGMEVRVASLSEGEDPDSFVRRYGPKAFEERVAQAKGVFDYKLDVLLRRFPSDTAEGKAKVAAQMLTTIHRFGNAVIRAEYIKRLGHALDIKEQVLIQEYQKVGQSLSERITARVQDHNVVNRARARAVERNLLRLMLEKEELIAKARKELAVSDFQDDHIRSAISRIFELFEQNKKINAGSLINSFQDPGIQQTLTSLLADEQILGDQEKVYEDCLRRMKHDKVRMQRQQLLRQIQEAESAGDTSRVGKLTKEFSQFFRKQ